MIAMERLVRTSKATLFGSLAVATTIGVMSMLALNQGTVAQQSPVTAIDIALEPDATMIQHAKDANARLLKVFPEGLLPGCDAPSTHLDATAVRPHGGLR